MWPLFVCAIVAVAVMIERYVALRRVTAENDALIEQLRRPLAEGRQEDALALCDAARGSAAPLLAEGIRNRAHDNGTVERAVHEWALREIPPLRKGLGVLDTVITLAPLLGLLGTILGMMASFGVVSKRSGADVTAAITGGVAEALIATATGLAIAIATLLGYNHLTERVKTAVADIEVRATRLLLAVPGGVTRRRGAALTRSRTGIRKPRIEIIPMIDAIFFLLVYFIMTSLSLVRIETHGVNRPESRTEAIKPEDKVVVSVTREGSLFVDKDAATEAQMRARVAARVDANPKITVIINCDRAARTDRFQRVFDLIKQANAANVTLATTPRAPIRQSQ